MAMISETGPREVRAAWYNDPAIRGGVFQLVLVLVVGFLLYEAAANAVANMQRAKIASGFGFFDAIAGFDISQRPIAYSATSTYGRAFFVGLINTLIISALGIVLATILGFLIGIARLSSNWLVAKVATVYVEFIRNIPLLLQLLFWYGAVLKPLPGPRQSVELHLPVFGWPDWLRLALALAVGLGGFGLTQAALRLPPGSLQRSLLRIGGYIVEALGVLIALLGSGLLHWSEGPYGFLNNRGLYFPAAEFGPGADLIGIALLVAVAAVVAIGVWGARRQMATGRRPPVLAIGLLILIGLPLLAAIVTGLPVTFDFPQLKGFNMVGGFQLSPEFAALLLGLTLYTASFIAEIVRGGIRGVAYGQTEAARALGLQGGPTLRLVVVPQAMRIIIPPLTNQYLNLLKNSSLAVAIGYPDLVQIFAGTVLNQTGQAIECIFITMAVYLFLSLLISLFMNWFNRRVALVER